MNKVFQKVIFSLILIGGGVVLVPPVFAVENEEVNEVFIQSSGWRFEIASGANVCEVVRSRVGSCIYDRFDKETSTHFVDTVQERFDLVNVVDSQDNLMATYTLNTGANHVEVVANRMGVDEGGVTWLSGSTNPFSSDSNIAYKATVRVQFTSYLIVRNSRGEVLHKFFVNEGVDHVEAVSQRMSVPRERITWISGEYKDGADAQEISSQKRIYVAELVIE